MDTSVSQVTTVLKALLVCGIVASVLRFATDMLVGTLWKGYSFVSQSISELSAIGAPTRSLIVSTEIIWGVLMIAFGLGVWRMSGQSVALRVTAGLLIGNAVVTLVVAGFLPARYGETGSANTSTANVVVMALGVVFYLLAMVFGAAAFHGWFRVFSIAILLAYVILTVVGLLVPRGATPSGEPMMTTGLQERTMMYSYLLWVAVLAVVLLKSASESVNGGAV